MTQALTDVEFLIYSSHKTSTQSLYHTLKTNSHKTIVCHSISHLNMTSSQFVDKLVEYKTIHGKPLKIISVVRKPTERLISSFFQSFCCDEIRIDKPSSQTTVGQLDVPALCELYRTLITTERLPCAQESIDELSSVIGINVISQLVRMEDYYYCVHELFELYVLDFKVLISDNMLSYLNNILGLNLSIVKKHNMSANKHRYYRKYVDAKKIIGTTLDGIIEPQYSSFYFLAF